MSPDLSTLGELITMTYIGLALMGAGLGAGIAAFAAGFGISQIARSSVESIARQPEVSGEIGKNMIITAALIEGVAFFAIAICFLISNQFGETNTQVAEKIKSEIQSVDK